jgi:hypothetical protein
LLEIATPPNPSLCHPPHAFVRNLMEIRSAIIATVENVGETMHDTFLRSKIPVIACVSNDGFSIPDFQQKLISFVQGNYGLVVRGAPSNGILSSHLPVLLARFPEEYESLVAFWHAVEEGFLGPDCRQLERIVVCILRTR